MIAGREGIAIAKIITFSYEIHIGNIFRLFFISWKIETTSNFYTSHLRYWYRRVFQTFWFPNKLREWPNCLLLLLFILFFYAEFLESPSKDINCLQQRIPYITNFDHNKQV